MPDRKKIRAYKVRNGDLPLATEKMNYYGDSFESKVKEIITGGTSSVVIVELDGSYPYIENEWNEFVIMEDK